MGRNLNIYSPFHRENLSFLNQIGYTPTQNLHNQEKENIRYGVTLSYSSLTLKKFMQFTINGNKNVCKLKNLVNLTTKFA